MKHIKKFNESTDYDLQDLADQCNDILMELRDNGFRIDVVCNPSFGKYSELNKDNIFIKIIKRPDSEGKREPLEYSEVDDYIERVIDFLKSENDFIMKSAYVLYEKNDVFRREDLSGSIHIDNCSVYFRNFVKRLKPKQSEDGIYVIGMYFKQIIRH